MSYFVLSSLFIILNTKPNVDTILKPFNLGYSFSAFVLIADSVSIICSSGLKEFKISTLKARLKACQNQKYVLLLSLFKKCWPFLYQ